MPNTNQPQQMQKKALGHILFTAKTAWQIFRQFWRGNVSGFPPCYYLFNSTKHPPLVYSGSIYVWTGGDKGVTYGKPRARSHRRSSQSVDAGVSNRIWYESTLAPSVLEMFLANGFLPLCLWNTTLCHKFVPVLDKANNNDIIRVTTHVCCEYVDYNNTHNPDIVFFHSRILRHLLALAPSWQKHHLNLFIPIGSVLGVQRWVRVHQCIGEGNGDSAIMNFLNGLYVRGCCRRCTYVEEQRRCKATLRQFPLRCWRRYSWSPKSISQAQRRQCRFAPEELRWPRTPKELQKVGHSRYPHPLLLFHYMTNVTYATYEPCIIRGTRFTRHNG